MVQKAYRKLWEGVDEDDPEACARVVAPFLKELEEMEVDAEFRASPVMRMKSTLKQVSDLVRMDKSYARLIELT
jgi:hypothetical protein